MSVEVSASTAEGEGLRTSSLQFTTNEASKLPDCEQEYTLAWVLKHHVHLSLYCTESDPVDNVNVVRVNSSTLIIKWTEPVKHEWSISNVQSNCQQSKSSIVKTFNSTWSQLTVVRLGKLNSKTYNVQRKESHSHLHAYTAPYTPYVISVLVVNGAGDSEPQTVIEFTVEGGK